MYGLNLGKMSLGNALISLHYLPSSFHPLPCGITLSVCSDIYTIWVGKRVVVATRLPLIIIKLSRFFLSKPYFLLVLVLLPVPTSEEWDIKGLMGDKVDWGGGWQRFVHLAFIFYLQNYPHFFCTVILVVYYTVVVFFALFV